jgi:hypothetical protein
MSFDREEAFAKIGKRVQLRDYEEESFRTKRRTSGHHSRKLFLPGLQVR